MINKFFMSLFVLTGLFFNSAFAVQNSLDFDGYISDSAYLFSDIVVENLNKTVQELQSKTGSEIVVVTLKDMNNKSVDTYLNNVTNIRNKQLVKAEHRVIVLYSMSENYLQLYLDDWYAGKITEKSLKTLGDNDILPYFKTSEYDKGLARGVYSLTDLIAKIDNQKIEHYGIVPPPKNDNKFLWLWLLLIPLFAGIAVTTWIVIVGNKENKDA